VTHLAATSNEDGSGYRHQWYMPDSSQLPDFLDQVIQDSRGRAKVHAWMMPHAVELVQETIEEELVKVQKHLYFPSVDSITPSFISSWSRETIIQPVVELAPVLTGILLRAAQSKSARDKNKLKDPQTVSKCFLNNTDIC